MSEKTIVITGVTRGLGRALTEEFIRRGQVVAGCGRSQPEIGKLEKAYGKPHTFARVDVTLDDQVCQWAKQVVGTHGAPDFLLNNAAIINRNGPLWKVSGEEFSAVIDVNIKGVANVVRHFLPAMIERGKGLIVNFSSGWGRSTSAEVAPYCATKWAIEGLTQALAQELPRGLAAIPLNPGVIDTDMLRSCFGASAGGFPRPAEWAKSAAPFILNLSERDNGRPMTVSGVPT